MSRQSLILAALVGGFGLFIAHFLLADVTPSSTFTDYRLAENLRAGHGLVYDPGDLTLIILSPLWPLILSYSPFSPSTSNALIWIAALALSAGLLLEILRHEGVSSRKAWRIVGLWVVLWPLWAGFRSPALVAWLIVLLALRFQQGNQSRWAGLIAGFAPLIQAGSILGVILLGLRAERPYWRWIMLPLVAWGIIAALTYRHLSLDFDFTTQQPTLNTLGIGAFLLVIVLWMRSNDNMSAPLWIFPVWATLELTARLLLSGDVPAATLPALSATIALGLILWEERAGLLIPVLLMALITFPPQIAPEIQGDVALGKTLSIPAGASLAHSHSDALIFAIPNFDGATYPLRNTSDNLFTLVEYAPDFVLTDAVRVDFTAPGLTALDYVEVAPNLWRRQAEIAPLEPFATRDLAFGLDLHLTAFRADHARLTPDEVLRVGFQWMTTHSPGDYPMALQINLLDTTGQASSTIFPVLLPDLWDNQPVISTHALHIPDDLQPGLYRLNVAVDYRAGILGRHDVAQFVLPFPTEGVDDTRILGELGQAILHEENIVVENETLQVEYVWKITEDIQADYIVFLHVSALDDLTPILQADGAPVGGRYPSTTWQTDDIIRDTRQIDLSTLPPGTYRLNVGFYAPATNTRMGDSFITNSLITITDERERVISPYQEPSD